MTSPSPAKTVTFVWDGNNPIHEIETNTTATANQTATATNHEPNITTWVFNDGFVPVAKITRDSHYSIITDYLGTPVEAYNSKGDKVWSAELDIYGRVMTDRNHTPKGDIDFIPFRYQGQYHDIETGLYYNRFRYYDPTTGNYTQQDPIGLEGNNPTLYAYVHSPHAWVDPFGLMPLVNPSKQGHHMVPHALATHLGIVPFNSQTEVPGIYFFDTQWAAGGGLNHSAMHGYGGLGSDTKPIVKPKNFASSRLTSKQWMESLGKHYENPTIQRFRGDLHIIKSDGTKGKLIKENVSPAEAWKEVLEWEKRKTGAVSSAGSGR